MTSYNIYGLIRIIKLITSIISIIWTNDETLMHIDELVQQRRNSIANTLELRLSYTNTSICAFLSVNESMYKSVYMIIFNTKLHEHGDPSVHVDILSAQPM